MDISPKLVVKVRLKCILEKNEKGLIQEEKNGKKKFLKNKENDKKIGCLQFLNNLKGTKEMLGFL